MAVPTLVATPGSASANSYATVAEATTYHESRLDSSVWTAAATDNKTISLIMATRLMDAMIEWTGFSVDQTQALNWPLDGMVDKNNVEFIPNTEIPPELKDATAEFARLLLVTDLTLNSDIEDLKIRSLSAGSVALTFDGGVTAKVVPDSVYFLLPKWWFTSVNSRGSNFRKVFRA